MENQTCTCKVRWVLFLFLGFVFNLAMKRFTCNLNKRASTAEYPLAASFCSWPINPNDLAALNDPSQHIVCQKVTALWKVPVRIVNGSIYKGPYSRDSAALCLIYERSAFFEACNDTAAVLYTIVHTPNEAQFFAVTPYLGSELPPTKVDSYLPRNHPEHSQRKAPLICRETQLDFHGRCRREVGGVSRGSDEVNLKGDLLQGQQDWKPLLFHFCLRYILRVADTGLHNVVNARGIDYEEVRKEESSDSDLLSLLFPKRLPSTKQALKSVSVALRSNKDEYITRLQCDVFPITTSARSRRDHLCNLLRSHQ